MDAVEWRGTSTSPITIRRASPSARWGSVSLLADGNALEHVILDGGYKNLDFASRNNTLTSVTSRNGWRNLSSGAAYSYRGRSEVTVTESTFDHATSVGVVVYNTDLSMTGTTVSDNAEAGLWASYGDVKTFTGNTVVRNGAVSTIRSGVELNSGASLVASNFAMNRVEGNGRHEVHTSGSAVLDMEYGQNSVCDGADLGVVGKYVYEDGSYTVNAIQNWWGTPSPTASMFYGTVYFSDPSADPYPTLGCESSGSGGTIEPGRPATVSSNARAGQDMASARTVGPVREQSDSQQGRDRGELRARIRAARAALQAQATTAGGPALAARLYWLQRWDTADALGESAATAALFEQLRRTPQALRVGPLGAVAERASLALIDDALHRSDDARARALLDEHASQTPSDLGRAEVAAARVEVLRREGRYGEALAALGESAGLLDPGYVAVVEADLQDVLGGPAGGRPAETATRGANLSASSGLPTEFALGAAYPNPSSGAVTVPFALPEAADVEVVAYDLLGRRVETLAAGRYEAGRHAARLDRGTLAPGVYVVRAVASPGGGAVRTFTQRVTIVR